MSRFHPTLAWTSDRTLRVGLGEGVSPGVHARVRRVYDALRAAGLPGVADLTPAYATVQVTFDLAELARQGAAVVECRVREVAITASAAADAVSAAVARHPPRTIDLPVCYDAEFAPDLADVARLTGLTRTQVVERHTATPWVVYFVGFTPGFAYMGPVDDPPGLPPLDVPRLGSPRARVPAGSVGLAGTQTGVYPSATPGGWRLIGRTPLVLFDPTRTEPALLRLGDRVRFRAITLAEFNAASHSTSGPSQAAPQK